MFIALCSRAFLVLQLWPNPKDVLFSHLFNFTLTDSRYSSHLCYGHNSSTGTVRLLFHQKSYDSRPYGARPAAGRIVRFLNIFLDIVRCPVKFRYYLKFHGARTAFGRVIEGKMTSAGHRTVPGRRPAGIGTHRTGTWRFLFKIFIVRFQRSYDVWQAPRTLKKVS